MVADLNARYRCDVCGGSSVVLDGAGPPFRYTCRSCGGALTTPVPLPAVPLESLRPAPPDPMPGVTWAWNEAERRYDPIGANVLGETNPEGPT